MPFDPRTAQPLETQFDPVTATPMNGSPNMVKPVPAQQNGAPVDLGMLWAGVHKAANTATFGLADKASAALAAGLSHVIPGVPAQSYDESQQRIAQQSQAEQAAHPLATAAGDFAGLFAGGVGIARGLVKGAKMLGTYAPKAVQTTSRLLSDTRVGRAVSSPVGRTAVLGGAVSGLSAAGEGDDTGGVVGSAATGAVLGPIAGWGANKIANAVQPVATKAAQTLAKVFREDPADMQAAMDTFKAATGSTPTMAQLVQLKNRGDLAALGKQSPIIGESLIQDYERASLQRVQNMRAAIGATGPAASSAELGAATKTAADKEFGAVRQQIFDISEPEKQSIEDMLTDIPLMKREKRAILGELENNKFSVNSAEMLRQALSGAAKQSPGLAGGFKRATSDLTDLVGKRVPEWGQAVNNYAARAQATEGAELGEQVMSSSTPKFASDVSQASKAPDFSARWFGTKQAGVQMGARSAMDSAVESQSGALKFAKAMTTDQGLHDRVSTALGKDAADRLRRISIAETQGEEALRSVTPGLPRGMQDKLSDDSAAIMHAVAAVQPSGSPFWKAFHVERFFNRLHMSDATAKVVAKYLTDPNMTQQGINLMQKAGATNAQIRRMVLRTVASVGLGVGQAAGDKVGDAGLTGTDETP